MKVVILDDWEKTFTRHPQLDTLKDHFTVDVFTDKPSKETIINRVSDADIIIPIRERTKFTKELLQHMKNVSLIAKTGAGLAHIDMEEAN